MNAKEAKELTIMSREMSKKQRLVKLYDMIKSACKLGKSYIEVRVYEIAAEERDILQKDGYKIEVSDTIVIISW